MIVSFDNSNWFNSSLVESSGPNWKNKVKQSKNILCSMSHISFKTKTTNASFWKQKIVNNWSTNSSTNWSTLLINFFYIYQHWKTLINQILIKSIDQLITEYWLMCITAHWSTHHIRIILNSPPFNTYPRTIYV